MIVNINKLSYRLVSVLLMFCIVRCSLVMTVGMSLFNLSYIIMVGGLGVVWLLLSNETYRKHFLGLNFVFLVSCVLMVGLAILFTVNNNFHIVALTYFKQLIVLILIWGIYVYLKFSSIKTIKKFIAVYIFCVTVSAIYTTYVAVVGSEDIIRMTAFGEYDKSFRFVFALVLIYTALLTSLRLLWKQISIFAKIVMILLEVLFALTITVSGYGTAFALILIFTLWQLRPKGIFGIVVIIGFVFVIFVAIYYKIVIDYFK